MIADIDTRLSIFLLQNVQSINSNQTSWNWQCKVMYCRYVFFVTRNYFSKNIVPEMAYTVLSRTSTLLDQPT